MRNLFSSLSCRVRSSAVFFSSVFLALVAMQFSPVAAAAKNPLLPGYGSHGMAVFGGVEGLYASHLPMFHQPHDVQLVFRFHLKDVATDTALRTRLSTSPALWTLDPEAFDLYRFAPQHATPLTQFQARFVEGHFERGGKEQYAKQTVVVDEVIVYRKLDVAKRVESAGKYIKIGAEREQFLLKVIDRRPDFDIIVAINRLKSAANRASSSSYSEVMVPVIDLKPPTTVALESALNMQGKGLFSVLSMLYFETDDLK
jgi:hypothetical protein